MGSTGSFDAMFAGAVSATFMNLISSISPVLVSWHTEHLWLYIFVPVAGATFASPIFYYARKAHKCG